MKKVVIIAVILLVVGGIVATWLMRPESGKPTLEEANAVLAESFQNLLELDSYTIRGDWVSKIKDGETVLFGVTVEDMEISVINPFDFANQDSNMVVTYGIIINFEAIAGFIEEIMPPEELAELADPEAFMGIDLLETMRALGEANISVAMEMKSIDFDSYIKIVEVAGLSEIVTQVGGIFMAEMVMGKIEPYLGVWHKPPADPVMVEEMPGMFEKIEKLILPLFHTYHVREVLPDTRIDGVAVYNFALGIDLEKMKDVVISFIPLIAEEAEMGINEKEEIKAAITDAWPKVVKVIEGMEIDFKTYICQETRFTIQDTGLANIELYELMEILEPIIAAEMTPEEIADFERAKEVMGNLSIVTEWTVMYSEHNAVPPIEPPAEYEVIGIPEAPF